MNTEYNPQNEFYGSTRSSQALDVSCYIHPSAVIGCETKIWHFAVIQRDTVFGANCSIGSHAEISAGCILGSNVRVGHGSITAPSMKIGDNVFIGPNVTFCDDDKPIAGNVDYFRRPPTVLDGASIGAGAIIMPGVTIGRQAMVGAGAIVLHDVPDFAIVLHRSQVDYKVAMTHITSSPAFVVVCRSGGDYTLEHATCLRRQFQAFNTDPDFQFWCLTDTPSEPWHIRLEHDWPGWWAVQEAWRFTGPTILTGLDTLFCRQMTAFTNIAKSCAQDMVWGTHDFYEPNKWANAVMIWNGDHRAVTDGMTPEFGKCEMCHTAASLDAIGCNRGFLDEHLDGIISYKKHVHVAGSALSEVNARVVAWHGMPRPWHDKCAGTWAGRMYRAFMRGDGNADFHILSPGSIAHNNTKWDYAWVRLAQGSHQAKCWLTYRSIDGIVSFSDWQTHTQSATTNYSHTPLGVRWHVSQLTAEVYLMILNGKWEEAQQRITTINDIVYSGGADLWPPCVLNWLRCSVLNQYACFLDGLPINESSTCIVENWRRMAHKYDWHKWPMRVDEMIHDIRALNILASMLHKRTDAPWLECKKLVSDKEVFHRCLRKLGDGKANALF